MHIRRVTRLLLDLTAVPSESVVPKTMGSSTHSYLFLEFVTPAPTINLKINCLSSPTEATLVSMPMVTEIREKPSALLNFTERGSTNHW